eukprot:3941599-Rhodomonas_salina.1
MPNTIAGGMSVPHSDDPICMSVPHITLPTRSTVGSQPRSTIAACTGALVLHIPYVVWGSYQRPCYGQV